MNPPYKWEITWGSPANNFGLAGLTSASLRAGSDRATQVNFERTHKALTIEQAFSRICPDRPAVKRAGLWSQRPLAWRLSP